MALYAGWRCIHGGIRQGFEWECSASISNRHRQQSDRAEPLSALTRLAYVKESLFAVGYIIERSGEMEQSTLLESNNQN